MENGWEEREREGQKWKKKGGECIKWREEKGGQKKTGKQEEETCWGDNKALLSTSFAGSSPFTSSYHNHHYPFYPLSSLST